MRLGGVGARREGKVKPAAALDSVCVCVCACVRVCVCVRFYLFIFRQRGREGEREGEKRRCVVASPVPLTGDLACNPGMCPDWDSNQRPLTLCVLDRKA